MNLIRFHSWCPPEAAFTAADELGFYYHIEIASWGAALGDSKPVDAWLYEEAARILKAYGNHPSFMLMPYGNEPEGKQPVSKHCAEFLAQWVANFKAADPRRLYTSASGWPQIAENQFHITADPRIQGWGQGLDSRINAEPPETKTDYRDYISRRSVPVISDEIGQWCVYPNFDEIPKYTGYLKPKNFGIFRDRLEENGLGELAKQYLLASGKLQSLCYKEDIESALRTPGMGGFELLDLHDYPGEGTALVGVLDPFWDSKGYMTAAEFRRFCNSTVPLARLKKRVFTTDERLEADLEVAHFGPHPLTNSVTVWKLVNDNGEVFAKSELPATTIPVDNGISLGRMSADLKNIAAPKQYKLVVSLAGTQFENGWDIWIYPPNVSADVPADIMVENSLTDTAMNRLRSGGKVLLLIPPNHVKNTAKDPIQLGFSSIFWNTAYTHRQAPTTLGILCNPKNAAFAEFPTDSFSNWQWWYLIRRAHAMILDGLPVKLRPIVEVIDDWVTARRLGLVFEAKVGQGKLVVCSIDLLHDLEDDPVRRQFRHSLLNYMAGEKFNPKIAVTPQQIGEIIAAQD